MLDKSFYPYGVSYYRPPTPDKIHWEKDLANIAATGMNTIRVSAFWSRIERVKDQYNFSEFDSICDASAKHGLKVLMTLYIVNMPEWMFTEYPDSRMVSAGGRIQCSEHHPDAVAGGWPGLCMDDNRVMDRVRKFVRAITLHYKGCDTLLAFDVIHEPWEEPSQEYYIDSWKNAVYCYCDHTIKRFRSWLQEKYGALEALNMAWSRTYSDWEQVQPPRNVGAYTDWLDWRTFSVRMVARECDAAGKEVKASDPERLIVNHTGGIINAFASSVDAFAIAETVDIPGMSNYSIRSPHHAGMSCDILRCASGADGAFWVGETSGGSGPMFAFIGEDLEKNFAFGMPWSREIQRKHIWKMIAHGARGILYWMWRPELYGCETAAMGFTDREGNLTGRTENAREIGQVIGGHLEFFRRSKAETAQTAVLYNLNTSILEGFVSTVKSRGGDAGLFANYKDLSSLGGAAKMAMEMSLPLDYVNDTLIKKGRLQEYRMLILPYCICIGSKAAEEIRRFVEDGGTVVADALCGYFLENGRGGEVVPAEGLDKVFGCKVLEYGYSLGHKISLDPRLGDADLESAFVKEVLSVTTGQVAGYFQDGSPAVVVNAYGKGKAVYFASSIFMHRDRNDRRVMGRVLEVATQLAGVEKRIAVRTVTEGGIVEGRVLSADRQELLVIMNHGDCPAVTNITLQCTEPPKAVRNMETGEEIAYALDNGAVTVTAELGGLGVLLVALHY